MDIKKLDNMELVEEFEKAIRHLHYDHNMEDPKFSANELREEILERLSK